LGAHIDSSSYLCSIFLALWIAGFSPVSLFRSYLGIPCPLESVFPLSLSRKGAGEVSREPPLFLDPAPRRRPFLPLRNVWRPASFIVVSRSGLDESCPVACLSSLHTLGLLFQHFFPLSAPFFRWDAYSPHARSLIPQTPSRK